MTASALFEKTLRDYSGLCSSDTRSLAKYCKDHHVDIRGMRYWMKKHSIPTPKRAGVSHTPSLVPLSMLACVKEKKSVSPSGECIKNVQVSFAAGSAVSIEELSCQDLIQIIHALK